MHFLVFFFRKAGPKIFTTLISLFFQKFIAIGELDPLNRRHSTENRPDVVVQGKIQQANK